MPPTSSATKTREHKIERLAVVTRNGSVRTPRILNCLPSPNQEHDWGMQAAHDSGAVAAPKAAAIPAKIDLRNDTWWPIGDQEATGSCVGWATADGLLRWHFTKAGRIVKGNKLSVRYLWMAAKERDEYTDRPTTFIEPDGTSLKAALDIARNYGSCTRRIFRSIRRCCIRTTSRRSTRSRHACASRRITTSVRLRPTGCKWIATQGPILARLDCDKTWMNAKATHGKLAGLRRGIRRRWSRRGHRGIHADHVHHPEQLGNHRVGRQGLRVRQQRVRQGCVHRGLRRHALSARRSRTRRRRSTHVVGRLLGKTGANRGSSIRARTRAASGRRCLPKRRTIEGSGRRGVARRNSAGTSVRCSTAAVSTAVTPRSWSSVRKARRTSR